MGNSDDDDDSGDDDSDDDDSGDSDDDDDSDNDSDDDDSDDDSDGSDDDDSDDSDDDSSDSGSGGSSSGTTQSATNFVDVCVGLTASECNTMYDTSGNAMCVQNVVSDNCYAVVASKGIYGSGNYDDGFTAAQQTAQQESDKLNTIVGVLAGIIVIMALGIVGGAYYFHTKTKRMEAMESEAALEKIDSTTHDVDCEELLE